VTLLIRDAEIEGRRADVRIVNGDLVSEVGVALRQLRGEDQIDARGGALIPGLHDHHIHLFAGAAALDSVPCGPPTIRTREELAVALGSGPAGSDGWVRGVGYHDSVAGQLDRVALDLLLADRPVRVQDTSGASWVVNDLGAQILGLDDSDDPGIERVDGRATGRVWRFDAQLRAAIGGTVPDVQAYCRRLVALGITGVTDATPHVDAAGVAALEGSDIPQRITALGVGHSSAAIEAGPWKLVVGDHSLPDIDELTHEISSRHETHRPVAVHVVTREALLLALAAFDATGVLNGDRLEHAAVAPRETLSRIASLGLRVVVQPTLVEDRRERYLADVDARDLPDLHRYRSLLNAGIRVAPSSDAPYGDMDPWRAMRAATSRTLSPGERVPPATVLAGYLSSPLDPGGPPRRVRAGLCGVCLLHLPLHEALESPDAAVVRAVGCGGRWLVP
jgi:predicted amidohydrolase YtcJ